MTDGGMRFRVLGGLEWDSHGVSLHIGRRRERLLLGLLLLDMGRVVPAHRLIDLLWDEGEPPASARGSLQVHVSRLRGRFLEAGAERHGFALAKGSDGYLVEGDPEAVDVHRFRGLLRKAERTEEYADRLRLLESALADWGGPVLAGTAPDGLVRRLGAGFDELYLSAVTQRAEARLALGQRGLVLEELARATADHPHHERLALLRMVALYRADHRGEALEVYNETRTRLAEDLGLDPGADLRRVQSMILRADSALLENHAVPGDRRSGDGGARPPAATPGRPAAGHGSTDRDHPDRPGHTDVFGHSAAPAAEQRNAWRGETVQEGTGRGDGDNRKRGNNRDPAVTSGGGGDGYGNAGPRSPSDPGPGPGDRRPGAADPGDGFRTGSGRDGQHHPRDTHPDTGRDRAARDRTAAGHDGRGMATHGHPPPGRGPAGRASGAPGPLPARSVAESVRRQSRTGAFIGRALELEQLTELAAGAHGGSGVVMIVGPAGSGKTALALQWCRGTEAEFPDGQLFLDLRGHSDDSPMRPWEALSGLLRALGVPFKDIPHDCAEMAELYQRTLAGRRVLIVLDNAESADQVRQLLPYEAGCLALVTSRNRLGALIVSHGAAMLPLRPLASDEAEELVRCVVGECRAAAEPEALAELVAICGRTPLALRIAAANIALRPDVSIADHVRDLRSGNPLESLAVAGHPDSAVRRAFELSYRRLDPEAAKAFRMLGLLPGPSTSVAAVGALLGDGSCAAHHVLDRLFAEHLVEHNGQERLRLHDLIWWYARLLVDADEDKAAHREARLRLLHWYTASADAAARSLYPQILRLGIEQLDAVAEPETFADPERAADWFDAEHTDLVRLIEAESDREPCPAVWILADIMRGYFWLRRDAETWIAVATAGLRAAQQAGDFRGQAAAYQSLGLAAFTMGDLELSRGRFEQAIELARRADWGVCESVALSNLAGVSADLGLLNQAAEYYDQCITLNRRLERTPHQPLQGLSEVLHGMGRLKEAEQLCRSALALSRKIAAPDSIARISTTLAHISAHLGELETAHELASASRKGFQSIGNLAGEAETVCALAMITATSGEGPAALKFGLAACRLSRRAGRPRLRMEAMLAMGHARYQLGQYARAHEHFRIACRIAEGIGLLKGRTMALLGLGVCAARSDRPLDALCHAGAALELAQESQLRLLEGQAQIVIALAQAGRGDIDAASRARRQAETIYRTTGYRPVHSPFAGPSGGYDLPGHRCEVHGRRHTLERRVG
ncbi:BTAD domain-containing putative transcriptional regulator [Streptomyces sp. CAU 1734]|uniref:AfsR/SARP family transcriptional regulator n=1 Tax=Streptomyces sp. CAU 1734 TaxID=3140360 RepID=UPI003260606C